MPPIAKPKENRITKLAKAVKARSPLPKFVNDAVLPTEDSNDVMSIPMGGALEPAISAGASMLSPLITIYKDKAAREAATQAFIESVRDFAKHPDLPRVVSNAWTSAGDAFAGRYPRIAAHVRQSPAILPLEQGGKQAGASIMTPIGEVTDPMRMYLHTGGVAAVERDPSEAYDFMFHEMGHAAQSLGNKDADELYGAAASMLPYNYIPQESTARMSGAKGKFAIASAGTSREAQIKRKFMEAYGHPSSAVYSRRAALNELYAHGQTTGDWGSVEAALNSYGYPNFPGSSKMMRQVAERGFQAPEGTQARLAGTRITKIMNRREAKPMAPTREQLTQMSPFAKLAMKLNLK